LAEKLESYRDLKVWQRAMALAEACYLQTRSFPREEMFGLTSQIRRAATSIAANIAEGYGREQTRSYVQFLRVSQGSLKELETHLLIARRVGVARAADLSSTLLMCEEVGKMLRSLIRSLQDRAS